MRTSYLAEAQSLDLELYEATKDQPKRKSSPSLTEVDHATSVLMGIHELLQQLIHWSAAGAPRKTGKPKVKPLPRPKTAADIYARRRAYETHLEIEAAIRFVPQDEFERVIAGGS